MSRRDDAGSGASIIALARSALARGHAALAANDPDAALNWLERAHRLVPNDPNVRLALASACLGHMPMRAASLFAAIADQHDVRQAWIGLAAANLRMNRLAEAQAPLAKALARHAFVPDIVSLANQIASNLGAPGWCGLTSGGEVTVHSATAATIEIWLDSKVVRGTCLPRRWAQGDRVDVRIGGKPAVGSPIQIGTMRRTIGCVEACEGGIRGWAWHPGDPDTPVALTLDCLTTGHVQRLEATIETIEIPDTGPLARPRAFFLTRDELVGSNGLIHVRGPDGNDLLGSPLDPAAEKIGQRDATLLLGQLYRARSASARSLVKPGKTRSAGSSGGAANEAGYAHRIRMVSGAVGVRHPVLGAVASGLVLRADSPVPAEAVGVDHRKRATTVVIPVHDGTEVATACLTSVFASDSADSRIIVVDDGSSDAALISTLDALARQRKIRLLRHPHARGFPASANTGILAASGCDVVLLNSDVLVPSAVRIKDPVKTTPGWVERLRDAAYAAPNIGTVTPFSNDAAILSYPGDAGTNPRPNQASTDCLDRLAYQANGGEVIDIPVGVGFCLYLRRDCLDIVGLLRDDIFAQGYGEENDFCLRARRLGWRNVALTGLFIGHHSSSSFGTRASHLRARNARILERVHPGHDDLIARFLAQDPLADARRRMDLLRWKTIGRHWRRAAILIAHNDGGGVERRLAHAVHLHAAAGRRPIVLRPVIKATGEPAIAVRDGIAGNLLNLVYSMPDELPELLRLLRAARPDCLEVHHLLDHPQQAVQDLVIRLGIPYDVHIHDYTWFCPRVTLLSAYDRYCGEPDLADCEACVADLGHFLNEDITVAALRTRSAAFLAGARMVVTPSNDTSLRMERHFPGLLTTTIPHEDDLAIPGADECPRTGSRPQSPRIYGRLRVCIVGGLGMHKGYDVVLGCARDAVRRDLALEFVVVGNTIDDERLLATGRIFVTGGYQPDEAVDLIVAQQAQLGFVPSIWPETWCLSLGDIWRAGLPAAAFDIGAPAERIRRTGRGFLLPLGLPAGAINDALLAAAGITRHA